MKPRDIQRSVRSQRVERAAGDAPSIGRVGRVPGTGLSKGSRRRKKRGESGRGDRLRRNRKKVLMAWSVLFMVVVMAVVGVTVWLQVRSSGQGAAEAERNALPAIQERVVSRFESPSEEDALVLVKRALAIRETSKVAEYFHPGAASPDEVVEFLREMEKSDGRVLDMIWLSSMDANGLLIDGVVVNTVTGIKPHNRLALLTPDAKGKWKIDFEAFARTARPSWSELLEKNAEQGIVRVIVAKDSYFNGPFKDEAQWVCYGMASPDNEMVLLGYCRTGSPQAAAMERIVSDAGNLNGEVRMDRATLEIRRREGGDSRQFEITRVLAEDWVMGAKPFDEISK
jgi:hypothetical protein